MENKKVSQTQLNNLARQKVIENLKELYIGQGEDVLQTKSNVIVMPTLDSQGNEIWIEIKVSVPRGSKGEVFDGYEQAEEYAEKEALKKEKEKEKEIAKEKAKVQQAKRRAKQKEIDEKKKER